MERQVDRRLRVSSGERLVIFTALLGSWILTEVTMANILLAFLPDSIALVIYSVVAIPWVVLGTRIIVKYIP
jgi:hypothetical protein